MNITKTISIRLKQLSIGTCKRNYEAFWLLFLFIVAEFFLPIRFYLDWCIVVAFFVFCCTKFKSSAAMVCFIPCT